MLRCPYDIIPELVYESIVALKEWIQNYIKKHEKSNFNPILVRSDTIY